MIKSIVSTRMNKYAQAFCKRPVLHIFIMLVASLLCGCQGVSLPDNVGKRNACAKNQIGKKQLQKAWNDTQKELYRVFQPKKIFEVCNKPRYEEKLFGDVSGTNLVLKLPNGEEVNMIWCPGGVFSMGTPLEEIIDKHPTWTYKDVNSSDIDFIHHVYVPGFWISEKAFDFSDYNHIFNFAEYDNNDRLMRHNNGITWNEAMRISGVFEKAFKNTQIYSERNNYAKINFKDDIPPKGADWGEILTWGTKHNMSDRYREFSQVQFKFRIPTFAELQYASLAGNTNYETNSGTNNWGLVFNSEREWCYDVYTKNDWYSSKTIYSSIVTNRAFSHTITKKRRIKNMKSADVCMGASPYDLLSSPKSRVVIAYEKDPTYNLNFYSYSLHYQDFVGTCPDAIFLNDRLLWAESVNNNLGYPSSSDSPKTRKMKNHLTEYINFLKPRSILSERDISESECEILLGLSLLVEDYIAFRELTKIGCSKTPQTMPPSMILAAEASSTNYLSQLFYHGEKINSRDSSGNTPLHIAVYAKNIENVKWLLEHGAKVTLKDDDGYTPLDIARERGYNDIITLLKPKEEATPNIATSSYSLGTAWFISDNIIITCHHVVEGCTEILSDTGTGPRIAFSVIAEDANNDIAILKAKSPPPTHASLPISSRLGAVADSIFTVGYPMPEIMGSEKKYNEGTISALSGIGNDSRFYQISIPLQPGNSGGAIVSESGVVIGLATSALDAEKVFNLIGVIPQNVNYAVKSRYITALLQDNGIQYEEVPIKKDMNRKELVDYVSRATILIKAK